MRRIGDYEIERETSDGYEARHVVLPRRAHLAVMHPTFVGLRPVAVRMMREACILEALRHPGVPRVYEVGVIADGHTQRPWIATELVEGESLDVALLAGDLLALDSILDILGGVAQILAHAHARNVAHRGVRPEAITRRAGTSVARTCLVNWSEARVPEASEDAERAFADDIFALGLVADLAIGRRDGLPTSLQRLVEDMLAPNPMSRPRAAAVVTRIDLERAALGSEMSADIEELPDDALELVIDDPAASPSDWRDDDWAAGTGSRSARRKTVPPHIPTPSRKGPTMYVGAPRLRWTPARGADTTQAGVALARLQPTKTK